MSWTEEKVEKLKELWGKKTASEIAQIIGNVSRNAIIGKANRLGLRREVEKKDKINIIKNEDVLLETKGCRWPFGDPGNEDFYFCGAKQVPGKPYCLEHCMLAYRKKESRKN